MGFTTGLLGLNGERISAHFGELRNGCPHKGTDYTSSRMPKEFTSGVYGKVIGTNGNYGTITIVPFHAPEFRIQYIHCSEFRVRENDIVQPWTVIGVTGETAPPGTGITGIHLHLQIETTGTPANDCWNGRNFTDPERWPIVNPIVGEWIVTANKSSGNQVVEETLLLHVMGDEVGDRVTGMREKRVLYTRSNGTVCQIKITKSWPTIEVLERKANTITINIAKGFGTASSSNNQCKVLPGEANASLGDLQLISHNKLLLDKLILQKVGGQKIKNDPLDNIHNQQYANDKPNYVNSILADLSNFE